MASWSAHHPEWSYTLYDNDFLRSYKFRTERQIKEYLKRGQHAGAADLMRLEILYEVGGFMPGADSICLKNMDELFGEARLYTIFENELVRGKLVSPIQASPPGHPFLRSMIDVLSDTDPADLDEPWITTGNLFTAQMIERMQPEITIFPSHFMIPVHFTGVAYSGSGPVYAMQLFGTTRRIYGDRSLLGRGVDYIKSIRTRGYRVMRLAEVNRRKAELFKRAY